MVIGASKFIQEYCATARAESPEAECYLVLGRVRKRTRGFIGPWAFHRFSNSLLQGL
jgi:hypothetical protein